MESGCQDNKMIQRSQKTEVSIGQQLKYSGISAQKTDNYIWSVIMKLDNVCQSESYCYQF